MTYRAEIVVAAGKHGLDPDLVQALVEQESEYEPYAWNPEPRYRYFWNVKTNAPFRSVTDAETVLKFPPDDFPALRGDSDNEWWAQQASWGLTQILGAVAREHGFAGPYLPAICDPIVNLDLGCLHLAAMMTRARKLYTGLATSAERTVRVSALASYNGGPTGNAPYNVPIRNRDYAMRVLTRYERIRGSA